MRGRSPAASHWWSTSNCTAAGARARPRAPRGWGGGGGAAVTVPPVDAWPQPGRLSLVEHIELHGGGLAYTTAVTLAKLGVSRAVVGRGGGDPLGEYIADGLRAPGGEGQRRQDAA